MGNHCSAATAIDEDWAPDVPSLNMVLLAILPFTSDSFWYALQTPRMINREMNRQKVKIQK